MLAHAAIESVIERECKQSEGIMQIHGRMKRKSPFKNDQCAIMHTLLPMRKKKIPISANNYTIYVILQSCRF